MLPLDRITTYIDQMKAWYDVRTKSEQVNRTLFQKLQVTLTFTFILICNDLEYQEMISKNLFYYHFQYN